ncbi:DUF3992 domain-containing protein [Peribacillus loiseleuriae]|uniref:DUF3992 domain-containing protein n=1 Tax=Peribacillus loiseleuriae TaxID=1679170 RepID=UPI00382C6947
MSEVQITYPDSHCINITKVFDWIVHLSTIRIKNPIFIKRKVKIIKEEICRNFYIEDNEQGSILLWEGSSPSHIASTVWISNESKNDCIINVFVNDKFLFSVLNGQSKSITIAKLQSLSITTDSKHGIKGKVYMVINKKMAYLDGEKKNIKGNKKVECFFTDQCGNQTNHCFNEIIECEEVLGVSGRTNRNVMLPSGKSMLLQKVKLRIKGYVCIKHYNDNCYIGPLPFFFEESFFLCAPNGTTIACIIENAHCHATLLPSVHEDVHYVINLSIELLQHVKVLGNTNVLIEGNIVDPCKQ